MGEIRPKTCKGVGITWPSPSAVAPAKRRMASIPGVAAWMTLCSMPSPSSRSGSAGRPLVSLRWVAATASVDCTR